MARTGGYRLYRCRSAINGAALPQVSMVDIKQELRAGNGGSVSRLLQQELQEPGGESRASSSEPPGQQPMLVCVDCGFVPQCPGAACG
ncbi:MAG: hypothetical protein V8S89_04265 [Oscillospiraceae bacterium]